MTLYTVTGHIPPTPPFDFAKSLDFLGHFKPMQQEHMPLDEKKLLEAASRTYGRGQEMTQEALQGIADRYGPWQGYWAHYLRVAS